MQPGYDVEYFLKLSVSLQSFAIYFPHLRHNEANIMGNQLNFHKKENLQNLETSTYPHIQMITVMPLVKDNNIVLQNKT